MAGGVQNIASLLGKVNASNALVVTLDGGAATATTMTVDTLKLDIANADVILAREAAGHSFWKNSTTAQRLSVANTYASTISYEAFSIDWQTLANNVIVGARSAATGIGRTAWFVGQDDNAGTLAGLRVRRSGAPFLHTGIASTAGSFGITTSATGNWTQLSDITSSATSGTISAVAITPTYNQASGSAANTDLLINRTQTAVGSGAQLLIDAQVSTSSRFAVDTAGSVSVGGANGQAFGELKSLTELTTIAAAASTDTTIQMPAGAVVRAVSVRTTVTIPTATSYSVGDSGSATRFNTANVGVAANSTDAGTKAGSYYNASALSVRLTMNGGTPVNNNGRVRVTIWYDLSTPPTS